MDHSDQPDDSDTRDIEALLAELDVDDLDLAAPPAGVWAGIEDRMAADPADDTAGPATVHAIAARRRPLVGWIVAAAAAVALVVAGVVVFTGGSDDEQVLSTAQLTFDRSAFDERGAEATAEAQLVNHDGDYSIRLTDARLPQLSGDDLELWLIEPDADGNPVDVAPVSLLDQDGDGLYQLPTGLDPATHYVVDISIEPRDGDSTHSGHSILRGALQPPPDSTGGEA